MRCDGCGVILEVSGFAVGTKVRCPACLHTFVVKYEETATRLYVPPTTAGDILVIDGVGIPRNEFVFASDRVTVGAQMDNDFVVTDAEHTISRHHVAIVKTAVAYAVEDLNSTNGTFINGERLEARRQYPLTKSDELRLGPVAVLTFRPGAGGESRTGTRATAISELRLGSREELILGRGTECDWRIDYPQVSRRHALLRRRDGGFEVRDLGSLNGTYVNGRRVDTAIVRPGDIIGIGPYSLVVREDSLEGVSAEGAVRLDAIALGRTLSDGRRILNDVNFSILPCEFVGILGGSGAGKSVLMAALNGSCRATEGRVLFNGRNLYRNFDEFRQQIGYVPQRDIIHSELSPERVFWYTAKLRLPSDTSDDEIERRVTESIEVLDLGRQRALPFRVLSGGQQKRVNLGVELITAPTIFFLDEPTSGLDPGLEFEMMQLFQRLAKEEAKTVALVTHVTENIKLMDKVAVMGPSGHLCYFGPPADAPTFFEVDSFVGIYAALKRGRSEPAFWPEKYRESRALAEHVEARADSIGEEETTTRPKRVSISRWLRQFWFLSRRYTEVITKDVRNTALLLGQAPAIAVLLALVFHGLRTILPSAIPSPDQLREMLLFAVALSAAWFGTNNAAKEISKEQEIFRRERMVNLRVAPYVLSKAIVLGGLAVIQCGVLLGLTELFVGVPGRFGANFLVLTLTGLAGVGIGLAVSAFAGTTDKAVALVPILLIPQIIFAGVLRPVGDMDFVSRQISKTMPVRWAYETMRATAVGEVVIVPSPPSRAASIYGPMPARTAVQGELKITLPLKPSTPAVVTKGRRTTWQDFNRNVLILVLFTPISLAIACFVLWRRGREGFEKR